MATNIILKCLKCKVRTSDWERDLFLSSSLRNEYKKRGFILQYCNCEDGNQPHVIIGFEIIMTKKLTDKQIQRMLK